MTDKKTIEEMAKDIKSWDDCYDENGDIDLNYTLQQHLYNLNYRKLPENAVVLTKEEYEKKLGEMLDKGYALSKLFMEKVKQQARKETVRGLLKALKAKQVICSPEEDNFVYMLDINELAKQHGVEVEE